MPDESPLGTIVPLDVIDRTPETRAVPASVLARLRALLETQQTLVDWCLMGMGIDLDRNRVDLNLDTGLITITPLA